MKNLLIIGLILITVLFAQCEKDAQNSPGTAVEIYLLDEFEKYDKSMAIIDNSVKLTNEAFIKYSELLSYNSVEHFFVVSDGVFERIYENNAPFASQSSAFAVVADNEIIYTGYFVSPIMSAIYNSLVIVPDYNCDPLYSPVKNKIIVDLGYPSGNPEVSANFNISDKRNDHRIIQIFRRDGKLLEK